MLNAFWATPEVLGKLQQPGITFLALLIIVGTIILASWLKGQLKTSKNVAVGRDRLPNARSKSKNS